MRKFIYKVTEIVEVSQLGFVGSGNKLQKQKKDSWSLEEGKEKVMRLAGSKEEWERHKRAPERASTSSSGLSYNFSSSERLYLNVRLTNYCLLYCSFYFLW